MARHDALGVTGAETLIGSNVTLKALNGVWVVVAADGVAITS